MPAGLPQLTLTATGGSPGSLTVSGQEVSGAVDVHAVVSQEPQASLILIRLNEGVTPLQAAKVLQSAAKDPNNVQSIGSIVFSATVPKGSTDIQTVLPADNSPTTNYIALDTAGHNTPRHAVVPISTSSSPATLPAASATTNAIEFGFTGSKTLKNGTLVRGTNQGWLVHMNDFQGVKSKAAGQKVIQLLKAGKPFKDIRPYVTRSSFSLFDPVSHGAVQQMVLNAKPGYYVEACFMTTQDNRPHTVLGMERLVQVK